MASLTVHLRVLCACPVRRRIRLVLRVRSRMPRKGERRLSLPPLDCELNQSDTFPKMSFHAFSDLPTLKQSASAWNNSSQTYPLLHIVVKDEPSTELGYKHVAHWITRILNATLEFSNPLRRELRIIVNVPVGRRYRPEILADETRPFLCCWERAPNDLSSLHLLTFTYSSQTPFPALASRHPNAIPLSDLPRFAQAAGSPRSPPLANRTFFGTR